jgi:hypothetical protein
MKGKYYLTNEMYQGLPSGVLIKVVYDPGSDVKKCDIQGSQFHKIKDHLKNSIDKGRGFGDSFDKKLTFSIHESVLGAIEQHDFLGRFLRHDELDYIVALYDSGEQRFFCICTDDIRINIGGATREKRYSEKANFTNLYFGGKYLSCSDVLGLFGGTDTTTKSYVDSQKCDVKPLTQVMHFDSSGGLNIKRKKIKLF